MHELLGEPGVVEIAEPLVALDPLLDLDVVEPVLGEYGPHLGDRQRRPTKPRHDEPVDALVALGPRLVGGVVVDDAEPCTPTDGTAFVGGSPIVGRATTSAARLSTGPLPSPGTRRSCGSGSGTCDAEGKPASGRSSVRSVARSRAVGPPRRIKTRVSFSKRSRVTSPSAFKRSAAPARWTANNKVRPRNSSR